MHIVNNGRPGCRRAEQAQIPAAEAQAILDICTHAQLQGLKTALLAAAAIALLSLFLTRNLPGTRLTDGSEPVGEVHPATTGPQARQ